MDKIVSGHFAGRETCAGAGKREGYLLTIKEGRCYSK